MKRMRRKITDDSGFTLVEIAIVLVIIGLLIGGVLKGQEMIKNAKIKRIMKTSDELRAAIFTYQDRFGYIPGDDPLATTHTGDASVTNSTNANGQISNQEDEHVFEHLAAAGLISGSASNYAASNFPSHPFGGTYSVLWQNRNGKTTNWITFTTVPVEVALAMDTSLDDGIYNDGSIRANQAYTNAAAKTVYVDL